MNRLRWVQAAQAVLITTVASAAGLVLLVVVVLLISRDDHVTLLERVRNYLLLSVWALVSLYGSVLLRRVFRVSAKRALALDGRPPILYLREFGTDSVEAQHQGPTTYEQVLVSVFADAGPVVALGRPGERVRPLGSIRLYAPPEGDGWKAEVERMIGEARFVIVEAGTSASLAWECQAVVRRSSPHRLMISFLTWWVEPGTQREERFAAFRAVTAPFFRQPLPARLEDTVFLLFEPDWTPAAIPLRGRGWSLLGQTPLSALGVREVLREPLARRGIRVGWTWTVISAVAVPLALGVGLLVAVTVPWYFLSGGYARDRAEERALDAKLDSMIERSRNLPWRQDSLRPPPDRTVPSGSAP